jgi:hypothetical protein
VVELFEISEPNRVRSWFAETQAFLLAAVAADQRMPFTRLPPLLFEFCNLPACGAAVGIDSRASTRSSRTMRRDQPESSERAVERILKLDSLFTARLLAKALRAQSA